MTQNNISKFVYGTPNKSYMLHIWERTGNYELVEFQSGYLDRYHKLTTDQRLLISQKFDELQDIINDAMGYPEVIEG